VRRGEWEACANNVSAAVASARIEVAAVESDPFAHPDEPVTSIACSRRTSSVVCDLELEPSARVTDNHPRLRGTSVFEHVGQRLLHDAVGGDRDAERKRSGLALDLELNRKPSLSHLRNELVELAKGRLGRMGWWLPSDTQHPQESPHLAERLPARPLDCLQCLAGRSSIAAERHSLSPCLDDHHAHAVRKDVV
jgi:hypothetical protein